MNNCRGLCDGWRRWPSYVRGDRYCRRCCHAAPEDIGPAKYCPCCGAPLRHHARCDSRRRDVNHGRRGIRRIAA